MLFFFFNMKNMWLFRILMNRQERLENVTMESKSDNRGENGECFWKQFEVELNLKGVEGPALQGEFCGIAREKKPAPKNI